jgi:hypothetical protein
MNKTGLVALAIAGTIVAIVLVLATGNPPVTGASDAGGDVVVGEGDAPPSDTTLADISEAKVFKEDDGHVVFEVTLGADIPKKIPKGRFELRWDVTENGTATWTVSANLDTGPTAAVQGLSSNFGASTIDGTLPGDIVVSGNMLTVTIYANELKDFPTAFKWRVMSSLDADRADPASAIATDTAPDSGEGTVD